MRPLKSLAAAAIAVTALSSSAHAELSNEALQVLATDDALKVLAKFSVLFEPCKFDAATVEATTFKVMQGSLQARPIAQRRAIGEAAAAELKEEIAAAGLPKVCAAYRADMIPAIRRLNDAVRPFAPLVPE
jgi:hypothetical protein